MDIEKLKAACRKLKAAFDDYYADDNDDQYPEGILDAVEKVIESMDFPGESSLTGDIGGEG